VYELLSLPPYKDEVYWEKVHIFFSDERFVPYKDPESNFGIIREKLLSKVSIPETHLHPFIVEASSLKEAVSKSEDVYRNFFEVTPGSFPCFDFVFLGMGHDGHAAGLFPGKRALLEKERFVVGSEQTGGFDRMSFTLPVFNAAREIIFLVTGDEKADMVAKISTEEKGSVPAGLVHPTTGILTWFLDQAASMHLTPPLSTRE